MLAGALIFFVLNAVVSSAMIPGLARLGAYGAGKLGAKGKEGKTIKRRLRVVEEQLTRIGPLAAGGNYMYTAELSRLQAEKAKLEAELAA